MPATESDDHHPKQKCDYDHGNCRDGHSPSTADLDFTHHLVHRGVFFHDESKRCIDCADAGDRRAVRQARADSTRPVPSGSSTLASAAVTPVSLHLSSERLQTRFVGPKAPAKPRPESWGISCDPERGLNQDDGPPHSVRMREGTPLAGCEDGLRPTSDGDRDRSATLANRLATTSFPRGAMAPILQETHSNTKSSSRKGRECPCCEA